MRAFLVDDEDLAIKRLSRLLSEAGGVEIVGRCSNPHEAVSEIEILRPDVLFLDIQMPGCTGFDLLQRLSYEPLVVFATAYDQYALRAFQVNSVAYLLKPVEREALDRALAKLGRMGQGTEPKPDLTALLRQMQQALQPPPAVKHLERLPSRTGDKVELVEIAAVTHFYAKDKLTFAATPGKSHAVDLTIQELEGKLDPERFFRIHRSTIVQLPCIGEIHTWFAGRLLIKLKDAAKTELVVSRDRAKELKDKLGI